ncbi:methyl-accepting chemotaxis protein [Desulfotignum phosphitoxidans]|uniref:Methyl-accepting chemotaxis transducer protein CheT n=1 Tax=Desulfotignum phosphitoxidans DSM 13687 TaxID=1286635 RepID=S0G1K2_9BACT|nr:methyl-accepting chemotaxis protein [Desulfotignum phosphitoxidans]EMS81183.1 methyl-accepting chemotaxis transducer protein CheT [Desulfotignum phosphitoxidans DSM 13687]
MFKNMKVGTKIAGGFGVGLVLTIIIGGISIYNISKIGNIVNRLATQEIPETSAVIETERAMWHTHVLSYEFDDKLDEPSKKAWFDQRDMIEKGVEKIIPIATALDHDQTLTVANDIKAMHGEYSEIGEAYTALALRNIEIREQMEAEALAVGQQWAGFIEGQNKKMETAVASRSFDDVVTRAVKVKNSHEAVDVFNEARKNQFQFMITLDPDKAQQLKADIEKLTQLTEEQIKYSEDPADKERAKAALTHTAGYAELMEEWVGNRQRQSDLLARSDAKAMDIIDLTSAIAVRSNKASYEVGLTTVRLVSNIKWLLFAVLGGAVFIGVLLSFFITRGITRPLNHVIDGLSDGAEQVTAAAGQVSSSSQSLAEGASEQAASIEETSSSMEEMSAMTQKNAENAVQADSLMQESSQVVSQANESMGQLTLSMEDISRASDETSKIIKTIDEIAFQTNLLALNAAVEAARAGEAGAGFAVVADEVRNLAMRAAEAAKNTAQMIEGTVKKVADGTELVSVTNKAFEQVAKSTARVGELVAEIAAASKEQSSGIDQVNTAVSEMDKVVQQNAASAEESASAAEEMSAQAEQLMAYVADLVGLVTGSNAHADRSVSVRQQKSVHSMPGKASEKAKNRQLPLHHKNEIRPDQVISSGNDDFRDF